MKDKLTECESARHKSAKYEQVTKLPSASVSPSPWIGCVESQYNSMLNRASTGDQTCLSIFAVD